MRSKSTASESLREIHQTVLSSFEIEPVKGVTDYSKMLTEVFRDPSLMKSDHRSKGLLFVRSILQDMEEQETVLETKETLDTRTVAVDHKLETSSSVPSSEKSRNSQKLNDTLRNILKRLKGDAKDTESKQNLLEKGPLNLSLMGPSNVLASSDFPNDSKSQGDQIFSACRNSINGQESVGAPPGLELPEHEASVSNKNVKKNDSINNGQGEIQKSNGQLMAACQPKDPHITYSTSSSPHTVNESSMLASNNVFADSVPTTLSNEECRKGNGVVNVQIKPGSDKQNETCPSIIGNEAPCAFPSKQKPLNVFSEEKTTASLSEDAKFTVCVEQHPPDIGLREITSVLSFYGDVVGSFRRTRNDGVIATFIEFMTDEAKEKALAAQRLHICGKQLQIKRVDQFMTTVVRISNASTETTEREVLFACEACGKVDIVRRRGSGTFDVYFKVRELPNMSNILNRLNDVTIDQGKWKVFPAPLVHPGAVKDLFKRREGISWYFSQQNVSLDRMEVARNSMVLDLQDMQELLDLVN